MDEKLQLNTKMNFIYSILCCFTVVSLDRIFSLFLLQHSKQKMYHCPLGKI